MSKDIFKQLIAEYQQKVLSVNYQPRNYAVDKQLNYVFTGLRRVGKSYLMYQIINDLVREGHSANEILYFNFEDDRIASLSISDLDLIKVSFEEMYDVRPIFFLDEIQVVDKWEKFARRLADQGYRVYITGSNARMLSSEIATTLGGRFMIQQIYPFSFSEYLQMLDFDINDKNLIYSRSTDITKAFETYFRYGGLPEHFNVTDKRAWLSNLFQKLFFGDLVTRYQVRNDFALKMLIRKLAESVKQPVSFSRLSNIVSSAGKKVSTDTIIDYLNHINENWICFEVENINAKLAAKTSNKKYYFSDNGLLNLFLIDPNTALIENMVAIKLQQQFGSDFYYYQNGVEVDFYIPEKHLAIQICYDLKDESTRKREVNALLKMKNQFEDIDLMIITKDDEKTIEINNTVIEVVPVWKWLLNH
ncbi:MAG: ATP-binding protein [Porphyromonadaceae bacterium CG2_30_38_12]|nr:MAG: ATP-binding protein [Porphyromonadaceae bacterium CG2_30_38_12]